MSRPEIYDEVAYCYDGTLEGLLSAIFASYRNKENPVDVHSSDDVQPRLFERVAYIDTNIEHAERVMNGLVRACGKDSFAAVCKASLSSDPSAPLAAYRFARFAMDEHRARSCAGCKRAASCSSAYDLRRYCPRLKGHALSNIAHPDVAGLFAVTRSVDNECEHVRQFARFEHVAAQGKRLWLARCAPRDAVTPLVMGHFARRFGSEPFVLLDETHGETGIWDGRAWQLVKASGASIDDALQDRDGDELLMQRAWRNFYRSTSNDARYHPELRVKFMPKRFWGRLTELGDEIAEGKLESPRPSLLHVQARRAAP